MKGYQLLEKLKQMTPEQLQFEVVAGGSESEWYYSACSVDIIACENGLEVDDQTPNCIKIETI